MKETIIIGTRGSKLALWQAHWVGDTIRNRFPETGIEYVEIKTTGDKILDVPLAKVGGKGLFVKEIEEALLDGKADIAVHSIKDIPTDLADGLELSAVMEREDPRDVLVSRENILFKDLKRGAAVGTSSLRRAAQLLYLRPDLDIRSLRGNVDTRLRKLETEGLDAILLAAAGIRRMGLESGITEAFDPELFIPAIGQGAIGIETRSGDDSLREVLEALHHDETAVCVSAERAFLRRLEGGCQVPIGAYATLSGDTVHLRAMVAGVEGRPMLREEARGHRSEAERMGNDLAESILNKGGKAILDELYGNGAS